VAAIAAVGLLIGGLHAAESPGVLEQADAHFAAGRYAEAQTLYRTQLAGALTADDALDVRKRLAITCIRAGKDAEAEAVLADIMAQLPSYTYGDPSAAVTNIADAWRDAGKRDRARGIYEDVIARWPDREHALWSRMGLAMTYVANRNLPAADAAIEALRNHHATHGHITRALCIIADQCRQLHNHKKARELYAEAIACTSSREFTIWSYQGLAISSLRLCESATAEAVVRTLRTDFANAPDTPIALGNIADEYNRIRKYAQAVDLYSHILDVYPANGFAFWARRNMTLCEIARRRSAEADESAGRLLADFPNDERLPHGLRTIADQYRDAERFDKAREFYRTVLDDHPESPDAFWAQEGLVVTEIRADDEESAQESLATLQSRYAADPRLPAALLNIGDQYRRKGQHAESATVYKGIIENHPTADAAIWALQNVGIDAGNRRDGAGVRAAVGRLIADYCGRPGLARALDNIVGAYRWQAGPTDATQIWESIIETLSRRLSQTPGMWDHTALLVAMIGAGRDVPAETIRNYMTAYDNQTDLPDAMLVVVDRVYNQGFWKEHEGPPGAAPPLFEKAVAVAHLMLERFPWSEPSQEACYLAGSACFRIDACDRAMAYMEYLLETWPTCRFAPGAHWVIAQSAERLCQLGQTTVEQARPTVLAHCRVLVADHAGSYLSAAQVLLQAWQPLQAEQGGAQ